MVGGFLQLWIRQGALGSLESSEGVQLVSGLRECTWGWRVKHQQDARGTSAGRG